MSNQVIKKRKKVKKFGFIGLFFVVLSTAAAVYMIATTILFIMGMIPSGVAAFTDDDKDKTRGLTVGAMNFVGVFPIMFKLWTGGNTVDLAVRLMTDPKNWIIMFVPAFIGWGIYFYVPPIVSVVMKKKCEGDIISLEEKQAKLVEEWGADVAELAMKAVPQRSDKR